MTLVECLGTLEIVDPFLRKWFASLVVLGEIGDNLRPEHPHLVYLRRKLDKVARCAGARESRVLHVREHAVQRVAKFVEQRGGEVEAQQRRLTGWWLDHVGVVENDRKLA